MTTTAGPTRPQLTGFCGYSLRHDLCRVGWCSCTCHHTCAACGQPLPTTTQEPRR